MSQSASTRWSAVASGAIGLVADVLLILFYLTAKPLTDAPHEGWYGYANDVLVMVQYAALVPVVFGLRRLMPGDARARRWSTAALAASIAVVVLQLLLVTGRLSFDVQVVPVSLCALVTMCRAAAISSAGERTGRLSLPVITLGRTIRIGLPIALGAFLTGFAITAIANVPWAWVAGGVPGAVVVAHPGRGAAAEGAGHCRGV